MKKRFTDIDKWKDPFYRKLASKYKTLREYIYDNCDNAGVLKPDMELASFCIGDAFEDDKALKVFNQDKERIKVLDNGDWFITDFISLQYKELNPACAPHRHVLELLEGHNILIDGLVRVKEGFGKGTVTLKEEDKEKEQEKEQEKKIYINKEKEQKEEKEQEKTSGDKIESTIPSEVREMMRSRFKKNR